MVIFIRLTSTLLADGLFCSITSVTSAPLVEDAPLDIGGRQRLLGSIYGSILNDGVAATLVLLAQANPMVWAIRLSEDRQAASDVRLD
jgi:hypothetical protein